MIEEETKLRELLATYPSLAIAFSGGTDSTLLAKVAADVLGDRLVLYHVASPLAPYHESDFAKKWARLSRHNLEIINADPLAVPEIAENTERRCYFCKMFIMKTVLKEASKRGIETVADGTNLDDYNEYRPGLKATEELGIVHLLAVSGFNKHKIRQLARIYGLDNWSTPPAACLATRIPFHTPLQRSSLKRIGESEEFLRSLGIIGCRVRVIQDMARLEVDPVYFDDIVTYRQNIVQTLKKLGFRLVTLDLEGYRTSGIET